MKILDENTGEVGHITLDLTHQMDTCERCLDTGYYDKHCPKIGHCPYRDFNGLNFKDGKKANTIINRYTEYKELIIYKEQFQVPDGLQINEDVDRSRKFFYDDNGILTPKNDLIVLEDLKKSMFSSTKRALDTLYGYALCNEWDYFATLTFDEKKYIAKKQVNRSDEELLKYAWKLFKQRLQYINKDVKILSAPKLIAVPERHPTSGKLHFHALIGNIDLENYITPAQNNNKKSKHYLDDLYTSYGQRLYNFLDDGLWSFGFSTLCHVNKADKDSQAKVARYVIKYATKASSAIGYNKRRYYATRNLNFKEKEVCYLTQAQLGEMVNDISVQAYKDNDKMTIYRIYNDMAQPIDKTEKP